jgi:sensor domain CHASE-containing protein
MTLRSKALLSVGLTFGVLGLACFLLIRTVLLPRFDSYESEATRANVQRVLEAIQGEMSETERRTFDWACWDDTYRFINDGNRAYIESNLV